mmetsp:Transcript_26895/g.31057  ORF Transcript_26895/g.31057 Transcript_26895/m.31057 type:complete len:89 (+) Transcript_26895:625-891(+)
MKDIRENTSYSTIDKVLPNDMMEDSLNTCSLKKDSEASQQEPSNALGTTGQTAQDAVNCFAPLMKSDSPSSPLGPKRREVGNKVNLSS